MIPFIAGLFGGWQKWLAIGLAFLAVLAWVGVLKIQNANLRADIAVCKVAREEAEKANASLAHAYDELRADAEAAVDAVTRDRDRRLAEAAKLKVVREKIHESAQACAAVEPPAYTDSFKWLRDTRP